MRDAARAARYVLPLLVAGSVIGAGQAQAPPPEESELIELVPEIGPPATPRPVLPEEDAILLQAGALVPAAFTPALNAARTQDALRLVGLDVDDPGYYLVQVAPEVLPGEAEVLINGAGGEIVGYVPHRTYMVRGPGRTILALGGDPACQLATAYHPVDRIHPDLVWRTEETASLDGEPRWFSLNVVTFPGEDEARVSAALRDLDITVQRFAPDRGLGATYEVSCPAPLLPWIAGVPGVQWIEEAHPFRWCTDFATGSGSSGTDILNISDLWATYSLNGSGMTVGHSDSGLDIGVNNTTLHRDFLNEAGTASRVTYTRAWGMRSAQAYWIDTYASSGPTLTTGPAFLRDSFVAGRNGVIEAVALYMSRDDTTPTGNIRCRVYQTSTPNPNAMPGSPLATSGTVVPASDLPTSGFAEFVFYFSPTVSITSGQTYWVVADLSGLSGSTYAAVNVVLRRYTGQSFSSGSTPASTSWTTQSDVDLMCRVADAMNWSDTNGHGTLTLGSLAGNGRRHTVGGVPRYRAPAHQASIAHQSLGDDLGGVSTPIDLSSLLTDSYDHSARVHSASWGQSTDGAYDAWARQVDQFMWDHPDFLFVTAAGNDGQDFATIAPPGTVNTSQALSSLYQYHCFKVSPAPITDILDSITLSLRRSSTGAGTINVHIGADNGSGTAPSGSFSGSFGSVDVSKLSTTSSYTTVLFNSNTSVLSPSGTWWVYLSWTSQVGTVYVGCNSSGTASDYVYWTGSTWAGTTANRAAATLSTGDGLVNVNSVGSPATSKNCLAIGATETDRVPGQNGNTFDSAYPSLLYASPIAGSSMMDNTGGMAAFSSRGPCDDGRYKPDVVAPGTYVASCRSQAIPALVSEDIEASLGTWSVGSGWTRTNGYGAWSGTWAYRAGGGAGPGALAYNANVNLTSQSTANGDYYLWFWTNYSLSGTGDTITLQLSDDAGTTWTDGGTWTDTVDGGVGHFTTEGLGSTWARGSYGAGNYHSASYSWRSTDSATRSDQFLILNRVTVPDVASPTLTFWHKGDWETNYDGGVLEVSTDGGRYWSDLGGSATAGGYNGTVSSSFDNPIAGRSAWTVDIAAWTQVTVDLADYAGQDVSFRWRMATDSSAAGGYWYLDDFAINGGTPLWQVSGNSGGWIRGEVEIPDRFNNQNDFRFRFQFADNLVAPRGTCLLDDFTIWEPNGAEARLSCLEASGWDTQNSHYVLASGTSISCPLAASVATLVREFYVEKKGVTDPSAALIKATMINEATDLSPGQYASPQEIQPRPDNAQGWGRVNAKRSLYRTSPRFGGYCEANSASPWRFTAASQTREIRLAVPNVAGNLAEPIKVTLVWTDRPGTAGANPALVNDLDLRVDRMSNATYPAWSDTVAQTWYGNGNSSGDRRNNVEQVDIAGPVTYGWYRIRVSSYALPSGGEQPWALVASGGFTNNPQPTPAEVENLRAERTGPSAVELTWRPAAGLGIVGCRVLRAERGGGRFEVISDELIGCDEPEARFVDRGAVAGREYVYRLELVRASGEELLSDTVGVSRTR